MPGKEYWPLRLVTDPGTSILFWRFWFRSIWFCAISIHTRGKNRSGFGAVHMDIISHHARLGRWHTNLLQWITPMLNTIFLASVQRATVGTSLPGCLTVVDIGIQPTRAVHQEQSKQTYEAAKRSCSYEWRSFHDTNIVMKTRAMANCIWLSLKLTNCMEKVSGCV